MLMLQTMNMMSSHLEMQLAIVDLMTHIHLGKVSPIVITPAQLKQHLKTISSRIDNEVMVPGDNTEGTLAQIYALLTAEIKVTPMRIILKIKLPLINREIFNVHHMIPVPFYHKNFMHIINTKHNFLAVNKLQNRYYMLTAEQKRAHCKTSQLM